MSQSNLIIKKTAEFHPGEGTYLPVSHHFGSMNDRINYRGTNPSYHIKNNFGIPEDFSPDKRKERYEAACFENGVRPFGYPEHLWQEHLRDAADEEYVAKCEAKDAWRYEN